MGASNVIDEIAADLAKNAQKLHNVPSDVGNFVVMSANRTIVEAQQRPDKRPLYKSLWVEGEVCCLFADSNVGKSIYAVQIAAEIAKTDRVLYFDFELSDKQFQKRYTDEKGNRNVFPDNLLRVTENPDKIDTTRGDYQSMLINNIEAAAVQTNTKILIIDNLTYLCCESEKSNEAAKLMMKLRELKTKHDLSILVLAHTPKRDTTRPIKQNDLAGSKMLFNLLDSVFAIGVSGKDNSLRYIKQIKVRDGEFTLDADNVEVCTIEKQNAFLQFVHQGYSTEREHLKEQTDKEFDALVAKIRELQEQGKTQSEIANAMGCSQSRICKILKKVNNNI